MSQLDFTKAESGTSLNFSKDLGVDMSNANIVINIDWGKIGGRSVDLDSCLALIAGGNSQEAPKKGFLSKIFGGGGSNSSTLKSFTYCFGQSNGRGDGVTHHGDDTTGSWSNGEFIEINTSKLGADVTEIIPSVLAYSNTDMSSLPFAHMRVYVGTKTKVEKPLFEVDLTDMSRSVRGAQFGKLVKNSDGEWVWTTDVKYTTVSGSSGFDKLKEVAVA